MEDTVRERMIRNSNDGILVEDDLWYYRGRAVDGPEEAALRMVMEPGDGNKWLPWRSLSDDGTVLTVLSQREIAEILAQNIIGDAPCAYNANVYCADDARDLAISILSVPNVRLGHLLLSEDSNLFPQNLTEWETDVPNHCACGPDCVDAIVLSDGRKIGALLPGQSLTQDGARYVLTEAEDGEVRDLWIEEFGLTPSKEISDPTI